MERRVWRFVGAKRMKSKLTQQEIIVRHLMDEGTWVPAHALIKVETKHGWLGSNADREARRLATGDCVESLKGKIEREEGMDLIKKGVPGLDSRFVYYKAVQAVRLEYYKVEGLDEPIIKRIYA